MDYIQRRKYRARKLARARFCEMLRNFIPEFLTAALIVGFALFGMPIVANLLRGFM